MGPHSNSSPNGASRGRLNNGSESGHDQDDLYKEHRVLDRQRQCARHKDRRRDVAEQHGQDVLDAERNRLGKRRLRVDPVDYGRDSCLTLVQSLSHCLEPLRSSKTIVLSRNLLRTYPQKCGVQCNIVISPDA